MELLDWLRPEVLHRAFVFAAAVCGSLIISHLTTVAYIAYHDLSGHWDAYSLKYQRNTPQTYLKHAPSFFFDVFCLLFPSLLAFGYVYDKVVWTPIFIHDEAWRNYASFGVLLALAVLNNIINRLWAMGVHWWMHVNKHLYQTVHKRHHCAIKDMCALSAWQDTALEFVLMEVLGVFLFSQLFNPLPWQFHVLLAIYNGMGGAIDHAGFYIPGTIMDGRYHWDHHLRINYNYSEIEFLDAIFGTLYVHSTELKANSHRSHTEAAAATAYAAAPVAAPTATAALPPKPLKAPPSPPLVIKRAPPSTPPTAGKPRLVATGS